MDNDLKRTLWAAADKLRSSMDAAEYKHIVLGLIFLKYISDSFVAQRDRLRAAFAGPSSELYFEDPAAGQPAVPPVARGGHARRVPEGGRDPGRPGAVGGLQRSPAE